MRPAHISDAQKIFELNSDPEVIKYTGDHCFFHDAHALICEKMIPQFIQFKMSRFMVFLKDGTFIGWCGLKYHPETNEVDLGYRFMQKYWGQGYALETSHSILRYGFITLNQKKIMAKVMPGNTRSIKVVQKLGMIFKGFIHDPTDPMPFIVYELNQSEYKECDVL
jgi:RimJ/RimL family protein N-acetyltransferase